MSKETVQDDVPGRLAQMSMRNTDFYSGRDTQITMHSTVNNIYGENMIRIPALTRPEPRFKPPLPPPPDVLFGRETEQKAIIDILLRKPPSRCHVPILGAGGMGKTSLALSVMHHDSIAKHYPKRYFVTCEAVTTIDHLFSEIADVLGIPGSDRGSDIHNTILSRLQDHPTLFCLDNFETPWEAVELRKSFEDFLRDLNGLPELTVLLTMRGIQRPSSISWAKPLLPPLKELSPTDRDKIYTNLADEPDEYAVKLLNEVGGVPLAVTLLATIIRDECESAEGLWRRWENERTSLADNGGSDRLSSLDISIKLSTESPRMRGCPTAIYVLSMIAHLPHGLPEKSPLLDNLLAELPKDMFYLKSVQTLKQVALIYLDEERRIRALPPIRQYCLLHHKISAKFLQSLIRTYANFLVNHQDFLIPTEHQVVRPELANSSVLLRDGFRITDYSDPSLLIECASDLILWSLHYGEVIIQETVDCSLRYFDEHETLIIPIRAGRFLKAAGRYHKRFSQLSKAEECILRAVTFYRSINDVLREADTLELLARVHISRNEVEKAEEIIHQALKLHQQTNNIRGEGHDLQSLGVIYQRQAQLEKAEDFFLRALSLHRDAGNILGESYDLQRLGEVYELQNRLDKAEENLLEAVKLHRLHQDVPGEGSDMQILGRVYIKQEKLIEAEETLLKAVKLHQFSRNFSREGDSMYCLGQVYEHQNKAEKAEMAYFRAVELYQLTLNVTNEAYDMQRLGESV